MPAKKKVVEEVVEEVVEAPVVAEVKPEEPEVDEAQAILDRIAKLKDDGYKNRSREGIEKIMSQNVDPGGSLASENGTPIEEYAAKVMAAQSPDETVVPLMLGIAKTRKALKNQGYELEDIERVIDTLEKAYAV